MSLAAYEPSKTLKSRVSRRVMPFLARRDRALPFDRPIISITFDDMPLSAMSAIKIMEAEGWPATTYIACGLLSQSNHHGQQISRDDVIALHQSGHEIAGHTFSHIDAQQVSEADFLGDCERNQQALQAMNVPRSTSFAYPYGQATMGLKHSLSERFSSMRGIQPGAHENKADLNQLRSTPLFQGVWVERTLEQIYSFRDKPSWLTLFTHDVRENCSAWGCSVADFTRIIRAIKDVGADVMRVDQAVQAMEAAHVA